MVTPSRSIYFQVAAPWCQSVNMLEMNYLYHLDSADFMHSPTLPNESNILGDGGGVTGSCIFNKCLLVILKNTQFGTQHCCFSKGGQTLKLGLSKSATWECVFSMHQEVWGPLC